jgi:hypothetical protein
MTTLMSCHFAYSSESTYRYQYTSPLIYVCNYQNNYILILIDLVHELLQCCCRCWWFIEWYHVSRCFHLNPHQCTSSRVRVAVLLDLAHVLTSANPKRYQWSCLESFGVSPRNGCSHVVTTHIVACKIWLLMMYIF